MAYRSTKTYGHEVGLSCAFRQWRADSHCRLLHGYALSVRLEFEADTLDARNWVIDFGSLKPVKQKLADTFDHKTVVAVDDPEYGRFLELHKARLIDMVGLPAVGCEAFATWIFNFVVNWLNANGHAPRVRLASVEVAEHGANSAIFTGP